MARQPRRTISQRSELTYDIHTFSVNCDTREIFLHGYVDTDEDPGVDYRMASTFCKNLCLLNSLNQDPITVHAITVGGDWSYGMAIYDAIVASRSQVIVLSYAHARSMSSIIPQAARWRIMMPNAYFMIHYGSAGIECNVVSFVSFTEQLKRDNETMLDIYVSKCIKGPWFKRKKWGRDRIATFLDRKMRDEQEWYISAHEAVDYGFADGIFGEKGWDSIDKIRLRKSEHAT